MIDPTMATYAQIADTFFEQNYRPNRNARAIEAFHSHLPQNAHILDVGCGPGYDAATFRQFGHHAIATDLSFAMMQTGRVHFGGSYVQADMRHLPFAAEFDGLWASASLLHLSRADVAPTLHQFARLLRRDGVLYLSVKAGEGDEITSEAYGFPLGRYFCYWSTHHIDALLNQLFNIIDGWEGVAETGTKWINRIARRK